MSCASSEEGKHSTFHSDFKLKCSFLQKMLKTPPIAKETQRRQLPELKNPDRGEPGEGPWDREPEGCCPGKPLQETAVKGSDSLSSRSE